MVVLLVACGTYLYLRFALRPSIPSVPVVAICKPLPPGMRRIGNRDGFQFDADTADFEIRQRMPDAPPTYDSFSLRPKNSKSILLISFGSDATIQPVTVDPDVVFSEHHLRRRILDEEGHVKGEEYWGYLERGKIWRRIHLPGDVNANYRNANDTDAHRFDRLIDSVCVFASGGAKR